MSEDFCALDFPTPTQENNMSVDLDKPDTDAMPRIAGGLISTPTQWDLDRLAAEYENVLAEATAEATELHDEISRLKTLSIQLRDNVHKYNNEHRIYKELVRDAIIELHEAGDLAEDDAAELLDTLELEGMKRMYTVQVTLSQTGELEIEATSEDDAYEKIQELGAEEVLDQLGGCIDYFDIEVGHVSAN